MNPSQTLLYRNRFRIPSTRLPGWDYRWPGAYAVTVCVQNRFSCLGEINEGLVTRSPFGEVVREEWQRIPDLHPLVSLDDWVVMPDHFHGILLFQSAAEESLASHSLAVVIGQFKKRSTKRIRARRCPTFSWQQRYYDQILRDEDGLNRFREYIRTNPLSWDPPENPQAP